MRRRLGQRRGVLRTALAPLLAAGALYVLAAAIDHPLTLIALLAANATVMLGCSRTAGFSVSASDRRKIVGNCLLYCAFAAGYVALVALLLAWPIRQLANGGSLSAALLLSVAFVVAIFSPFRIWPVFALPFIRADLPPHRDAPPSMAPGALIAQARELTAEPDVFFRYGLPPALMFALLAIGALAIAGIGFAFSGANRIAVIGIYALLISPLANGLLLRCTLRTWLAHVRPHAHEAVDQTQNVITEFVDSTTERMLPADIPQAELNETLLRALRSAQVPLALDAIEHGAATNTQPALDARDQRTPLMIAVTLPDLRPLRALIAKGADVNGVHGGITPLIAATRDSYEGRPDAVTTLLANGADANTTDAVGNTPLHHAARCENPIIAALLLDTKIDINAINADGHTALDIACANANWPLTEFLLDHRAATDVADAVPALLCAAGIAEDDTTGVRLLLKHRAKVDATAPLGRTALMTAALAGHARIVDTCSPPARAWTSPTSAARPRSWRPRAPGVAAIHALGKRKAAIDALDAGGRSALMHACQSRQAGEEAVRALLALGADRSLATPQGQRAVDLAAATGRWPIVALLDPAYPMPSAFDAAPALSENQPSHLLDALRFGHWNVVAGFPASSANGRRRVSPSCISTSPPTAKPPRRARMAAQPRPRRRGESRWRDDAVRRTHRAVTRKRARQPRSRRTRRADRRRGTSRARA
jgi:ankyrin repeat protein